MLETLLPFADVLASSEAAQDGAELKVWALQDLGVQTAQRVLHAKEPLPILLTYLLTYLHTYSLACLLTCTRPPRPGAAAHAARDLPELPFCRALALQDSGAARHRGRRRGSAVRAIAIAMEPWSHGAMAIVVEPC